MLLYVQVHFSLLDLLLHHGGSSVPSEEGRVPYNHLVGKDSNSPPIHLESVVIVVQHFWGCVVSSPLIRHREVVLLDPLFVF